ncbi:MAG: SPFH domain-containing protein [Planctomycetota bacterium]|jgi:uncharacterized membrane protein YqiK
MTTQQVLLLVIIGGPIAIAVGTWLLGVRYIPHSKVGIIEKLWSFRGSLKEGQIVCLAGEAGFQAKILRGGLHTFYFPWQYRIHRQPLVVISEGRVGYVYARDGRPLPPTQTLGQLVDCNNFQDARAFLSNDGQRGRQRAILREGVYAVNLALFVVITESRLYSGPVRDRNEAKFGEWQQELANSGGFYPVVIGHGSSITAPPPAPAPGRTLQLSESDTIGVVTVHDGPPIESGEIIAPEVKAENEDDDHKYFQNPEAFLDLGGHRGKQLQVLTDGTYFINRWFATVEISPKTLIPIGFVGVVVSYFGIKGEDLTGDQFRYGEQVDPGHRGVWKRALPPGKYALNPYALKVELVPTVNFVLRWVTGVVESHEYDKDLKSIELITADGYEPMLPLSLVLHIDYEKAPRVVQRFGDVQRLISQTLDPIISAYFRDVAQMTQMLDLLTKREEIQKFATEELGRRFKEYDINCVAVLIGRPESKEMIPEGKDPIDNLFDQLRQRRLAQEQVLTFKQQEEAATKLKELNDAKAAAEKQMELTQTRIDIDVAGNRGSAQLAEAERLAERDIARASGEARSKELIGKGEAARVGQVGLAEAAVFLQKIRAYGDPRLFAVNEVGQKLANSVQPLVPDRLLVMGGGGEDGGPDAGSMSLFGQLLMLLVAEKGGVDFKTDATGVADLETYLSALAKKAEADMGSYAPDEQAVPEAPAGPAAEPVAEATEEPAAPPVDDLADLGDEPLE